MALASLREAEQAGWRDRGATTATSTPPRLDPQRARVQGRLRRHRARHGAAARPPRRASEGCAARADGRVKVTDTPAERVGEGIWTRLRRRKVVQWGLAYVAGAWGFLQGLAVRQRRFHWPEQVQQLTTLALLIGLPIVLVLAWYHGDRGQRRSRAASSRSSRCCFCSAVAPSGTYQRTSETATVASPPPTDRSSPSRPMRRSRCCPS